MMFLYFMIWSLLHMNFFFFNDTATTEIYTLSLHDALPISDTAELDDIERRIRTLGFYSYRTSPEEHAKMAADEAYQSLVFDRVMRASVEGWVDIADTRLRDAGLPCLVMPGDDDIPAVKDLLSPASWL